MMLNPPPTCTDEEPASMSPPRSGSAGTHISRSTSASPANTRRVSGRFTWLVYHLGAGAAWPVPLRTRVILSGGAQCVKIISQRGQAEAVSVDDGERLGREGSDAMAGPRHTASDGRDRVAVAAQ